MIERIRGALAERKERGKRERASLVLEVLRAGRELDIQSHRLGWTTNELFTAMDERRSAEGREDTLYWDGIGPLASDLKEEGFLYSYTNPITHTIQFCLASKGLEFIEQPKMKS
jgi:hypothetical protein